MESKEVSWREYINKSLIVFGILGLDMIACLIGGIVDGNAVGANLGRFTHWYAKIFSLVLVMSFWFIGIVLFYKWMKKKEILDGNSFKFDKSIIIPCIVAVGVWFFMRTIDGGSGIPKFMHEYKNFVEIYGKEYALIISILQNIYYVLETTLVMMMIVLLQKAGEVKFKITKFPWAAIGLSITWGAIHLVSRPEGAIFVIIAAFAYGLVYVISKNRIIPLALVVFLPFIL